MKAGSLDYIDLRIAKGYDRGLQELVNRWVMFWRKRRPNTKKSRAVDKSRKNFCFFSFLIGTIFITDRYNLNHRNNGNNYVILGRDGSGLVTKVGSSVFQVQPGDRVWFAIPHCFQVHTKWIILKSLKYPITFQISYSILNITLSIRF